MMFLFSLSSWLEDTKRRWSHFIRHQASHSCFGFVLFFCFVFNESRESTFMPLSAQAGTKSLTSTEGGKNFHSPAPTSHMRKSQELTKNGLRPSKHRYSELKITNRTLFTLLPSCTYNIVTSHVSSTYFNHRYTGRWIKIPAACRKNRKVLQNLKFHVIQQCLLGQSIN